MEKISELLDEYGWALDNEQRRMALLKWMTEATNRIQELDFKLTESNERIDRLTVWLERLIEATDTGFGAIETHIRSERAVLGFCPHGVNLDVAICPEGCRR